MFLALNFYITVKLQHHTMTSPTYHINIIHLSILYSRMLIFCWTTVIQTATVIPNEVKRHNLN